GSAKGFVGKGLPTYVLPSWHESVHRDGKRSKDVSTTMIYTHVLNRVLWPD
ncbi:hypothetical protein JOD69_003864, partial [Methylocaldum sp. RMAD-M]|nr:hypothetical protein [Methylocaldum sp. RMAD-M]